MMLSTSLRISIRIGFLAGWDHPTSSVRSTIEATPATHCGHGLSVSLDSSTTPVTQTLHCCVNRQQHFAKPVAKWKLQMPM
jgi:hypothetical protein